MRTRAVVIEIAGRFFYDFKGGRCLTSWGLCSARLYSDPLEVAKVVEALERLGKRPTVRAVCVAGMHDEPHVTPPPDRLMRHQAWERYSVEQRIAVLLRQPAPPPPTMPERFPDEKGTTDGDEIPF